MYYLMFSIFFLIKVMSLKHKVTMMCFVLLCVIYQGQQKVFYLYQEGH